MSRSESLAAPQPVGHQGARVDIAQRRAVAVNGWFGVILLAICGYGVYLSAKNDPGLIWLPILVFALVATALVVVPPGQTSVVQFFGRYVGTVTTPGFWWVLPLTVRRTVSVRVRNFETNHLKVNDADGNGRDPPGLAGGRHARSTYAVENCQDFVTVHAVAPSRHGARPGRAPVLRALIALSGFTDLVPDRAPRGRLKWWGNGVEQIPHTDFPFHPIAPLCRRANVLVYLNPDWQGGRRRRAQLLRCGRRGAGRVDLTEVRYLRHLQHASMVGAQRGAHLGLLGGPAHHRRATTTRPRRTT